MCGQLNEVGADHYSPVGQDGRRADADTHPQLASGSVEFIAPQEYMVRVLLFGVHAAHGLLSEGASEMRGSFHDIHRPCRRLQSLQSLPAFGGGMYTSDVHLSILLIPHPYAPTQCSCSTQCCRLCSLLARVT